VILDDLAVAPEQFAATGWVIKPEGACRDDTCVPLPPEATDGSGRIAVPVVAEQLGMPLVHDEHHDIWALGPATVGGRALDSATAPDVVLPDLDGNPFPLSRLRDHKVLLLAWASW
jgi:hypothetical protein